MCNEHKRQEDLEAAKGWLAIAKENGNKIAIQILEKFFPELSESEDERIRKEIIKLIRFFYGSSLACEHLVPEDIMIAWVEKQKTVGETVERFKASWYNEGKIDGKFEGLTDNEKYQQGWHDALEKQGVQNPIKQDTEIRDLWVYIKEWRKKFGRLPKDEDELAVCIDYVMKRRKVQPQSKQEWSEEDKDNLKCVIATMEEDAQLPIDTVKRLCDWLKSLKFQNRWKPSEEQMKALNAINIFGELSYVGQGGTLVKLYNDLKNL